MSTSLWLQMSVVFCFLPYLLLAPLAYRQFLKNTFTKFLYPGLFHGDFNVFEFNPKANFILLEDQTGKKSSEGDIALSSNVKEFSPLLVLSATAL